jgi:A/G-specific adenine glycosylase
VHCRAYEQNLIKDLPVKERKIKIKHRFLNYLVPLTPDNKTLLKKRTSGIWSGLYEFPLIEADRQLDKAALLSEKHYLEQWENSVAKISLFNPNPMVHKLSHQHLHTQFWLVELTHSDNRMVSWESVENYPVPRLIDKFLESYRNK